MAAPLGWGATPPKHGRPAPSPLNVWRRKSEGRAEGRPPSFQSGAARAATGPSVLLCLGNADKLMNQLMPEWPSARFLTPDLRVYVPRCTPLYEGGGGDNDQGRLRCVKHVCMSVLPSIATGLLGRAGGAALEGVRRVPGGAKLTARTRLCSYSMMPWSEGHDHDP